MSMNKILSKRYNNVLSNLDSFLNNARTNLNYYLGNLIHDRGKKRSAFQSCSDNQIRRVINHITGEEAERGLSLAIEIASDDKSDDMLGVVTTLNRKIERVLENSNVNNCMLEVLKQGLISGCCLLKISPQLKCESSPLYYPTGTTFSFANSSISMNNCDTIFSAKLHKVTAIKEIIDQEYWDILDQYSGINTHIHYNTDEFNNINIEASTQYRSANNSEIDKTLIRIVEGYFRDPEGSYRILAVPTSTYAQISKSSYVDEQLIPIHIEPWVHAPPYCLFSPDINSMILDRLEHRFSTPTNTAIGLQYYLDQLLLNNVRITAQMINLTLVQKQYLEGSIVSLQEASQTKNSIVELKQDAPDSVVSFLRSPDISQISITQIEQLKDSILSTYGLSGQIVGEYKGAVQTSYALEVLRQKSSRTTIASLKRNYYECYYEVCKKIVYMHFQMAEEFSEGEKSLIFHYLEVGTLKLRLKETFTNHLEKDYQTYLYLTELALKLNIPINPELIVQHSPIQDKESIIKSIKDTQEAQSKLMQKERELDEREKLLNLKETQADIDKTKAETEKIKDE